MAEDDREMEGRQLIISDRLRGIEGGIYMIIKIWWIRKRGERKNTKRWRRRGIKGR